ncbi:biliverdin-producing heme oxygenase [Massilia sp. TN1-12]|uniref:biliverdin-producing heme oxygenase n=1 Tax=Massilia paldalensis TaxID=3377675 RepID=UPI00384BC22C
MDGSTDLARGPDPLAALRAATHTRHEELDSGLPIGKDDASLADYAAHLTLLRAWLLPLQDWLRRFDDGPQADARFASDARLALLQADLDEPGMPASAVPAHAAAWPEDASPAWRWGVAYVVEGSQLGGAVLYGRLHARLAPHPLRYLKGDEAGPGPRWRAFMQALGAHVRSPEEIADACAGACAAFDRLLALRSSMP